MSHPKQTGIMIFYKVAIFPSIHKYNNTTPISYEAIKYTININNEITNTQFTLINKQQFDALQSQSMLKFQSINKSSLDLEDPPTINQIMSLRSSTILDINEYYHPF